MSIFGMINDAILGHAQQAQQAQQAAAPAVAPPAATGGQQPPVDVDATLAGLAASKGQQLNYKSSIVDLMKLLGLDSSLDHRKQLATELGYSGAKDGSAEMNIWLHQAVMRKLGENGGQVSAELRGTPAST